MKLTIEQSLDISEVEIAIKCNIVDPALEQLIAQIRLYGFSVTGKKDGEKYQIKLEDIFYFESVDDKTFIYCKSEVYGCDTKLCELEQQLKHTPFVRVSRQAMLNTTYISYVKSHFNGRFEANLENGERVIVNRHYINAFRDKFTV